MGRPLSKRFFGNEDGSTLGGKVSTTVSVGAAGVYTAAEAAAATVTFSAPQLSGGTTATGTIVFKAVSAVVGATGAGGTGYEVGDQLTVTLSSGATALFQVATLSGNAVATVTLVSSGRVAAADITAGDKATVNSGAGSNNGATLVISYGVEDITFTNVGSGYTSAPTETFSANAGADANITVTLDAASKAIAGVAQLAALSFDIVKQVSKDRYKVLLSDDSTEICKLVAAAPGDGEMTIVATDSDGKTYYVTKLTSRLAVLTQFGAAGHLFATGSRVKWTLGSAVAPGAGETGVVSIASN